MTVQEWLGVILTSLSIVALVASIVKWYIQTQISPIKEAVEDIRKETKTNGGSSMRDEIKSIKMHSLEADQMRRDMDKKLDKMYSILIDYISKNNK
jgi:hypothetical protein